MITTEKASNKTDVHKKEKVNTLLQKAKKELEEISPQAYQEATWILSNILNKKILNNSHNNQNFYLHQTCTALEKEEFWNHIQKRKNHYPLDYILGESCFLDHKFVIEEGVFIPRVATEILVERMFKQYPKQKPLKIMDWGAGAGPICLSLLSYFPKAQALAIDIHSKSLSCLKKNSERMKLNHRLKTLKGDVCKIDFKKEKSFSYFKNKIDLITANPPYIDPEDSKIETSVFLFEPPMALFSSQKGMGHIYSWFYKAMDCLDSGASYLFEFGWNQSQLVKDFLSAQSSLHSFEILKDSLGHDRAARVIKK